MEGFYGMRKYVLIKTSGGTITYRNVNPSRYNLPDDAQIFDDEENFEESLNE